MWLRLLGQEELGFGLEVGFGLMTKVFDSLIEKVFDFVLDYQMYVIEFICENSTSVEQAVEQVEVVVEQIGADSEFGILLVVETEEQA